MFSHENTKEVQTSQVEIDDTDADTLEQLLKYIYSGKLDCDMTNLASSLMRAADKYNIPRLKTLCEDAICSSIEVSNAADALVLAHMYEAKNLKATAVDFVMNNLTKVSETPGWTNITTGQHPKILGEMFKTLMEKLKCATSSSSTS
jgi:speckle-type POZ protein